MNNNVMDWEKNAVWAIVTILLVYMVLMILNEDNTTPIYDECTDVTCSIF